jgi:hypothetical protein
MKKFIGFLSLLIVLASAPVIAGESAEIEQALEKKQQLVLDGLKLSAETEVEFLPVYNAYQKDLLQSNRNMSAIISDFAENYNALTNVKAQELLAKWLDEQQTKLDFKKAYIPKFEKVMSKKELMRYYQIENKLETIVNSELRQIVPLAK